MPHHASMKYTTCCHYLSRMWLLLFLSVWELLLGYKAMLVLIGIHGASSSSRCMAIMRTSLPATFSYSLISASALSGSQKGHGLTRDAMVNSYGQLSSQTDTYAHANHYYIVYLSCALACEIFTCPLHKIICICIYIYVCMYSTFRWQVWCGSTVRRQVLQNETGICMLNEKNDYIMWENQCHKPTICW